MEELVVVLDAGVDIEEVAATMACCSGKPINAASV